MMRRRIRMTRKQRGCELHLPPEERALLEMLPKELAALLRGVGIEQPLPESVRRLFPRAYVRDEEAEQIYEQSTRRELLESHLSSLETLRQYAHATHLDEETTAAWMAALNDLRLVLGTVLGVTDEDVGIPDDAPETEAVIYQYLTMLQAELIDVMEQWLPDPVAGADDLVPEDPWGEPLGGLRWDGTPRPSWPPRPDW